ncbi:SusD/RagB family nutrient-binding outer membrane lipoprotein, partial [Bradyrhizobium sp. 18BD]
VYDKQQDVFLSALNDLDDANSLITANTASVQGDIVYNGNMQKWKQLINTFSLRILMNLSAKENNTTLNVKQRFANIVNNPSKYPLFSSNADNGQLKFYDLVNNRYTYYLNADFHTAIYMEAGYVDLLKSLNDVRLFSFADKAPNYTNLQTTDFNAYGGAKGSAVV